MYMDRHTAIAEKFLRSYKYCLEEEQDCKTKIERAQDRHKAYVWEYEKEMDKCRQRRHEVRKAIESLGDPEHRMILSYKFIDFMEFEEIAEAMQQELADVKKKALDALAVLEWEDERHD